MLTRRTVLKLMAASVPGLVIGCKAEEEEDGTFDPQAVPESSTRFPRTPIAGDMTATRIVLTFFVADDSPVTLRIWSGEEVVVDQAIEPSGDGFHKVMIDDLTPGTMHQYAVFSGEAPAFESRSLIGKFRTAPADDALVTVRFGLLSCIGQGNVLPDYYFPPDSPAPTAEPFQWELFTHAADHDLDALVHLGDQAYLDFVWMGSATVESYLDAWGFYHGGGYRDLYPHAPLFATWDDHEATDNGAFDPWDMSPDEEVKLANAQEAWFKVVPIDATEVGPIYRSFRWGATVELVLLDCRYELTPDVLVSETQLQFLLDRIANSPCQWVCVATPKPFADITTSTPLRADNAQRWQNYDHQRARVAAAIDASSSTVMFVSGDIHMNFLGRANITGEAASDRAWEVCVTSGNVNPLAAGLSSQQFDFVQNTPHFPVLTFDPSAGEVHVAFHATDGSVAFEQTLT